MGTAVKPQVLVRRERIAALVDLRVGRGIEIGPLDSPVAPKDECDVRYLDVESTDALREHFRDDPNVELDGIVDVDLALRAGGRVRSVKEVAAAGAPYDWVVASHIVEHVPDLVGWLDDLAQLLRDDGVLVLAAPDRRYTFDVARPATTVGQVLQAHTLRDMVPSERAAFDHYRSMVDVPAPTLWSGADAEGFPRAFTLQQALDMRQRSLDGEYVDSHVWVFTPDELVEQLFELGRLGASEFAVETLVPTARDELEFTLVLRRLPRDASAGVRQSIRAQDVRRVGPDAAYLDGDGDGRRSPPATGDGRLPGGTHLAEVSVLEERMIGAKRAVMRALRRVGRSR